MDLGPYIARLARNIGAFRKYHATEMHETQATVYWGIHELQLAGVLTNTDPPQWKYEAGAPPARQPAPRQRREPPPQQPARHHRPDPFTPESAFDYTQQRFDHLENRMTVDQQWTMQSHHRQDDMLRYMMSGMSLEVRPPFAGLLPPPPQYGGSGTQQQTPYVYGQYPGYDQWGGQGGYAYSQQYGWSQYGSSGTQQQMEEDSDEE